MYAVIIVVPTGDGPPIHSTQAICRYEHDAALLATQVAHGPTSTVIVTPIDRSRTGTDENRAIRSFLELADWTLSR